MSYWLFRKETISNESNSIHLEIYSIASFLYDRASVIGDKRIRYLECRSILFKLQHHLSDHAIQSYYLCLLVRDLLSSTDLSLILFKFLFDRDINRHNCECISRCISTHFKMTLNIQVFKLHIIWNWKLTKWDIAPAPAPVTSLRYQTGTITIYCVCVWYVFYIFILHTIFGLLMTQKIRFLCLLWQYFSNEKWIGMWEML